MKLANPIWSILLLALLLLQVPLLAGKPLTSSSDPAHNGATTETRVAAAMPCHPTPPAAAQSGLSAEQNEPPCNHTLGCVFCGINTPPAPPRIATNPSVRLPANHSATPNLPPFEQSVELHPPKG